MIKFIANDETNTRCFPATIGMMLSVLQPEKDYTMVELVQMAGTVEGKSTWPSRMLIELRNMGFEVVMIEGLDGRAFIRDGGDYLRRAFGDQTAGWMIANSDIDKERRDYQGLFDAGVNVEHRLPEMLDIQRYLSNGYMVKCGVNSKRLAGQEGYVGHSVLVLSVDDDYVTLHNPGLPPKPFQKVTIEDFEAAWASPNEDAKEMIAVR